MNLTRYIIILSVIVMISSCKAKRISTVRTIDNTDTIYKEVVKEIQIPVDNIITIEDPCDSTGILKDFKQTVKTKTVYIEIQGKDGELKATVNIDSIKQSTIKEYVSKNKVDKEVVIKTEIVTPGWAYKSLAANAILLLLLFRKKIPYLNLLPF